MAAIFERDRRPADDGKRSSAMDVACDVASRREDYREGVQGEGGARRRSSAGGWRITGSDVTLVTCEPLFLHCPLGGVGGAKL